MLSHSTFNGEWGIPVQPLPDELASSWLVRIARAYSLSTHSMTRMVLGNIAVWNRDLDSSLSGMHLAQIGRKVSVVDQTAINTSLEPFSARLRPLCVKTYFPVGILRLGVYHRLRRRHGLQYCPDCLRTDRIPYFRRHWRLAFLFGCPIHECRLLDACPACDAPVVPHRSNLLHMHTCFQCQTDLRGSGQALSANELSCVNRILRRWQQNTASVQNRPMAFNAWLAMLNFWYSRLRSGRVYPKLGLNMPRNHPNDDQDRAQRLEDSRTDLRRAWLAFIEPALTHPSGELIGRCQKAGVTSTALLSDYSRFLPQWFREQLLLNLPRGPRRARKTRRRVRKADPACTIRKRIGLTEAMRQLALSDASDSDG